MIEFTFDGLIIVCTFLLLFYLLIFKRIDVIGEPTSILFFVLSFSMSFVFVTYGLSEYSILILSHLLIFFVFVSIGCIFIKRFFKLSKHSHFGDASQSVSRHKLDFLAFFSWLSFFIILILNFMHIYKNGSVLFSDNVDEAKIMGFSGGSGLIRRINWSLLYFNFFCFFVLHHLTKNNVYILAIFILLLLLMSLGSKGALISVLLIVSTLYSSKYFYQGNIKKLNVIVGSLGIVGLVFSVIVYALTAESVMLALSKFYTRILYFGDINSYLESERIWSVFSSFNLFNFLDYLFNPLLGFFRLAEYHTPLGTQFVNVYNAGEGALDGNYGPNLTFYATAILFFGNYSGLIFSALIGLLVGVTKTLSNAVSVTRIFRFIIYAYIYFMSFTLVLDPLMFAGRIYDSLIIIGGVFFVSKLVWVLLQDVTRRAKHVR